MNVPDLENLTRVLQASISPVALISGVGLLILSQTNRLGRVMDRLRDLVDKRRRGATADINLTQQIEVLHRRARLLKGAVSAAVFCALLAGLLVLLVFLMAVTGSAMALLALGLFTCSLLSLITSLVLFLLDMNLSLRAVQDELLR